MRARSVSLLVCALTICAPTLVEAGNPLRPKTWQRWEEKLNAQQSYANPYLDLKVWVTFTHAGSCGSHTVAAPWNGGQEFLVRTMFPCAGNWTWTSQCRLRSAPVQSQDFAGDLGLFRTNVAVGVDATATGHANPLFRNGYVKASADGRYLVHRNNAKFYWLGDTAWAAPARFNPATTLWATFLEDRRVRGYTVLQVSPLYSDSEIRAITVPKSFTNKTPFSPALGLDQPSAVEATILGVQHELSGGWSVRWSTTDGESGQETHWAQAFNGDGSLLGSTTSVVIDLAE